VGTGGEDLCESPQHTVGFPSQPGMRQTYLDCYQAGTCHHTGTATPELALMAGYLYDTAPLPTTVQPQCRNISCKTFSFYIVFFNKKSVFNVF